VCNQHFVEGRTRGSAASVDSEEHGGEVRVVLNPVEERRFTFEKLDPSSYPNSAMYTVDEVVGRCGL
jgi:hypothetical protein